MGEVSPGGPVSLSQLGGVTGRRIAVSVGLVDALPAPRRIPSQPTSEARWGHFPSSETVFS